MRATVASSCWWLDRSGTCRYGLGPWVGAMRATVQERPEAPSTLDVRTRQVGPRCDGWTCRDRAGPGINERNLASLESLLVEVVEVAECTGASQELRHQVRVATA